MSSDYCDKGPATVGFTEWQSGWLKDYTASLATASTTAGGPSDTQMAPLTTIVLTPSNAATASWTGLPEGATATATGAEPASTTGAASSPRQDGGLLALMTGLAMAIGLLG